MKLRVARVVILVLLGGCASETLSVRVSSPVVAAPAELEPEPRTFGAFGDSVLALAFSPDGLIAVGSDDGTARVLSVADGGVLWEVNALDGPVVGVNFLGDGEHLAVRTFRGGIQVWSARGTRLPEREPEARALFDARAESAPPFVRGEDGREPIAFAIAARDDLVVGTFEFGDVTAWRLSDASVRKEWKTREEPRVFRHKYPFSKYERAVAMSVAIDPWSGLVAAGFTDGKVRIWALPD